MVAVDLGAERAAAQLYDLIEPWRHQVVWTGGIGYGSAETYLGMLAATLGSHERAREHFAAATRVHKPKHLTGWQARNQYELARSRLAAGARSDALEAASLALELAADHGYGRTANRAAEIVRVAGHAPRFRPRGDPVLKGSA
jgi:hypothetical protein